MSETQKRRTLVLVHGRGFKPAADVHLEICRAALATGITRDYPEQRELFDSSRVDLAWYGDLNAELLTSAGRV